MSKGRKHHRKVKQQRFSSVAAQPIEAVVSAVDSTAPTTSTDYIKKDLIMTVITVVLLAAALFIASYLNQKYHWTLTFGAQLYDLLHIR